MCKVNGETVTIITDAVYHDAIIAALGEFLQIATAIRTMQGRITEKAEPGID